MLIRDGMEDHRLGHGNEACHAFVGDARSVSLGLGSGALGKDVWSQAPECGWWLVGAGCTECVSGEGEGPLRWQRAE